MKKRFLCAAILLICFLTSAALANSWGLKGDLLNAVMDDDRWSGYSTITKQAGNYAVMGARYHNVLMQYKDGELFTYPLAVFQPRMALKEYQPMHALANKVQLLLQDDLLTIVYDKEEFFTFRADGLLISAHTNALNLEWKNGIYLVSSNDDTAIWQRSVYLSDFNIHLFPRTVEEISRLNLLYAALDNGNGVIRLGAPSVNIGKGTAPVYSSPFGGSAWRAASGKAAVGLSGEHWRLGDYINADGEAYTQIRYEVSERTQRIGFVRTADLNTVPNGNQMTKLLCVNVEAAADTYLTDDPLVSQFQQFKVPAGTQFTCMGTYGLDYAWVSAEVKNGKFVAGGEIVWGYVPLRDLKLMDSAVEWDAMAQYAGEWHFVAGGNQAEDVLMLYADGTYRGYPYSRPGMETDGYSHGTWRLTEYNPQSNLYYADAPYEITFFNEDGSVNVKGFLPTETGFSLLFWEGGGGYERLTEPFSPSADGNG